jgi:hypothetical protein
MRAGLVKAESSAGHGRAEGRAGKGLRAGHGRAESKAEQSSAEGRPGQGWARLKAEQGSGQI